MSAFSEDIIESLQRQFGKKLKAQRKKLKMTQVQLAQHMGMSRGSIVNFELGTGNPPMILIYSLAYNMGCEINDLLPTLSDVLKDEVFIEKRLKKELNKRNDLNINEILKIISNL